VNKAIPTHSYNFSGKKILLLGFGGEARASLVHLHKYFTDLHIGVADQSSALQLSAEEQKLVHAVHVGDHWLAEVSSYEIVIRSPGIPLEVIHHIHTQQPKMVFTSGTQLFLEKHRDRVWGVTGTKGKSTTSSLLYHCLKALDIDVRLCGNIGIPAISLFDENPTCFVMELSSYQLEDCSYSPHVSLFLNLFSEHLDHHGSFEAYRSAKQRIFSAQRPDDRLIVPSGNEKLLKGSKNAVALKVFFGAATDAAWIEDGHYKVRLPSHTVKTVCSVSETRLRGPGNAQNILAVLAALSAIDFDVAKVGAAIKSFAPLPHRLEEVGTYRGITFINDSISTVPEATINALETFGDAVKTVILGGFDRGLSFVGLAEYLVTSAVDVVILFPPSGARIRKALEDRVPNRFRFFETSSMAEAIDVAFAETGAPGVCLLSPASPSFPIFKNFEERGAVFRSLAVSVGEKGSA
jgi:UDP-N-acetylmuramoylalanine--D-glutamate ligase